MTATTPTCNGATLALLVIDNPNLQDSSPEVRLRYLLGKLMQGLFQPLEVEVCDLNSSLFLIAKTLFDSEHGGPNTIFEKDSAIYCQALDFLLTLAMTEVDKTDIRVKEKEKVKERAFSLLIEKMTAHFVGQSTIISPVPADPYLFPLRKLPAYLQRKVLDLIGSIDQPMQLRSQELRNLVMFVENFVDYQVALRHWQKPSLPLQVTADCISQVLAVATIISVKARENITAMHVGRDNVLGLIPHLVKKMWGNLNGYETIRAALLEPRDPDPTRFPIPFGPVIPSGGLGGFHLLMALWPAWAKQCGAQAPIS